MQNVESHDGYQWVNHGPETDDHLAWGGHEPQLAPILQDLSDDDKEYINIGAHVGTWAVRMAKYNSHVWAVEGNANTARTLQENIDLNNLEDKITVLNVPLWDTTEALVNFVDVNSKATGGSTRAVETDKGQLTHTLDSIFANNSAADIGLISMDIEGAEARILRGGMQVLKKYRPNLVIELHEGHPGVDEDIRAQVYAILTELEYDYNSVSVSPPEEHLICTSKKQLSAPEVAAPLAPEETLSEDEFAAILLANRR